MSHPLRIAIAGLGTVGAGIVRMMATHGTTMAMRAGRPLEITAVSARSRGKDRGVDLSAFAWEDDPVALARRDDVDLVIEVMGGEDGPAKALTEAALAAGKHVVTANKAMLAHHGQALATLAEKNDAMLRYEAAVAGGIPVMKALTEGLAANGITRVMGVLNGTCNYILTQMEEHGYDYESVLSAAQEKGYAEADPSFDVGGIDAAHKLALLAATAFGTRVDFDGVQTEGIEQISLADILMARDLGYRIKLLGVAQMTSEGLEQRMQPCLVPAQSALGGLQSVTNMVVIEGDFVGQTVFQGPGAGEGPTASAILGDVIDIARGLRVPAFGIPADRLTAPNRSADGAAAAYYLRLTLDDTPGALATVAGALAAEGISIDQMRQSEPDENGALVLIVTHETGRAALDRALNVITQSPVSLKAPVALRIENV
ncbi:homoserine dehydrogenase [Pontivivens insulae]|uniref:Homoserine dehydrogenase n=1 Tax=Pontivivens insulae TaxID=1639689 RepID=A0A2R8ADX7_9RHOB|nr:homoserine dehydrogenase [Pontivivens insulae]RED14352.1 homoserine dehydrogenase [Pontivivens insulae]SPF30429.1 Homoserine dehydrogenase [Pontivivens insulae]